FPPEVLFAISEARGRLIKEAAGADAGTMAAVAAPPSAIGQVLGSSFDDVWIANVNSPKQTVLAGRAAAVDAAVAALTDAGLVARRIPVSCAFHSPLVQDARRSLAAVLADTPIATPRIPVFSNALAAVYPSDAESIRGVLSSHITSPVRF